MNEASPAREVSMGTEDRGGQRLILPADGYEWRKYGQKFIKNIGKTRSYFKCHKENCNAKKRVEWSESEPDNIRVVYDGIHTHALSAADSATSTATSNANQYNLLNQVFGNQSTSTRQHENQSG